MRNHENHTDLIGLSKIGETDNAAPGFLC